VRGGPDSVAKLTAHAARTARTYALEGVAALGISVLAALDDIGIDSLDGAVACMRGPDSRRGPKGPLSFDDFCGDEVTADEPKDHGAVLQAGASTGGSADGLRRQR
jgi:hypothetical protein